jgi:hypothetical protein
VFNPLLVKAMNGRSVASLSLDLDNKWSYLKTHGEPAWQEYPGYLESVVPRVLAFLAARDLRISFFVVGQDCTRGENRDPLRAIADAGHEIANHSFHHDSWLHLYSEDQIEADLAAAEEAIEQVTGVRPRGFRGPGFSVSPTVLRVLARRGYDYDASTLPTFTGPLARAYYLRSTRLSDDEKARRAQLYGSFRDGLRPLDPYIWRTESGPIVEVPVTTLPVLKVPIHVSYLLYLAVFSRQLASAYFTFALTLCRIWRVMPSLLLHPTDFFGRDEVPELGFFPAMSLPTEQKLSLVAGFIDDFMRRFTVVTVGEHARSAAQAGLSALPSTC